MAGEFSKKVNLIYLGKKGGGNQLLIALLDEMGSEVNARAWVSSRNESLMTIEKLVKTYQFSISHTWREFLKVRKLLDQIAGSISILAKVIKHRNEKFLVLMISPNDKVLYRLSRLLNLRIVTCVHDYIPHLGQYWPTLKSSKFRIERSKSLIVFSKHVQNQVLVSHPKSETYLCKLPTELFGANGPKRRDIEHLEAFTGQPRLLFIGRLLAYKGVDSFLEACEKLPSDWQIIIAGEGELDLTRLPVNVKVVNRWLSEQDIDQLLKWSQVVLFPYRDASQSGFLPLAISYQKYVVITEVGGLVEQAQGYKKAVCVEKNNLDSLLAGICKAVENLNSVEHHSESGENQRHRSGILEALSDQSP